jgi:hypothetical protein
MDAGVLIISLILVKFGAFMSFALRQISAVRR